MCIRDRRYTIQITEVRKQNGQAVKGIQFQVTDPALLNQTGGIIQGMSGSPILQNGKLIGAVTHMVTSQPDNGYGCLLYTSPRVGAGGRRGRTDLRGAAAGGHVRF